jgi:hypothetical protein
MTNIRPWRFSWIARSFFGVLFAGALFGTGDAFAERVHEGAGERAPDYFVAAGVRAWAHDPTSLVLAGKAKLVDVSRASVSVRGALLFGPYKEARLPLTVEMAILPRISPFAGGGVAYGTDGLGAFDPMLTGGVNLRIIRHVAIDVTINYIFQLDANDDDKEIMGSLAFVF